jgi:hypothetical protein
VKKSAFRLRASDSARGARPPRQDLGAGSEVSAGTSSAVQQQRLGDAIEPEDYVELGDGLWRSLTSGYRFAVDRTYLNSLPTETAQRL